MKSRSLRVEQALDLLPELDDLIPLRDALIGASALPEELLWSGAEAYLTLDTRTADAGELEARIPELVSRERDRTEAVYRGVLDALRAFQDGDSAGAATALVRAGEVEEGAGRIDSAERFYERAAELGRRPRDRRAEGLALRRLGRTARSRGDLHRSLSLYRRGFEVAEAERDSEGMVIACQGLGNVLAEQGRWSDAEAWYRRGLEILPADPPSRSLWQLESNLSAVARRAGRLRESGEWLERARRTVERTGDASGRVYVDNAAGLLAFARGELERAEAAYRQALTHAQTPAETARVLVNLAEALLERGVLAEAESVARRLEQIAVTHALRLSLPYAYRVLGGIARARKDENGFLFFEQALEICRSAGFPELELALTQHEYGRFEARLGLIDSARARLQEASKLYQRLESGPELDRVHADLAALGTSLNDHVGEESS